MDHQTLIYHDTVDWLFDLQFVGIKLGLENIRSLAAFWDNPHLQYPVIHVAGSNGKGSTASFIASALQAAGYRTGLYTSPHLVDFSERIRVDGVPMDPARIVVLAQAMRAEIARLNATFFEATTVMAFRHFADEKVDVAVVETGLGGRLDATNIVSPALTVITSISVEHVEFLGDSLASIAVEKAGIIKPGVPCVTPNRDAEVLGVLERQCDASGAALHRVPATRSLPQVRDLDSMECVLPGFDRPVEVGLVGAHQAENAATAVTALRLLARSGFPALRDTGIREGLREVRARSGLRGRLERLQRSPELVVDVGHNPAGIDAMLGCWSQARETKKTDMILGVLKTKDLRAIFQVLTRHTPRSITLVQADSHEARSLEDMLRIAEESGAAAEGAADAGEAVRRKLDAAGEGSVLLFGSHYVVGAFLKEWEKNADRP
jgi:dihydrofolate synthase/folylpolyglutamate synthase